MSNLKPILKKKENLRNKTRKSVMINPNFNEVANDNPEPITPNSKNERWSNAIDSKLIREELRNKKKRFESARKAVPNIAARTARQKYNIPSPPSSPRVKQDLIQAPRTSRRMNVKATNSSVRVNRVVQQQPTKGPITRLVSGFMNIFKKGGKKTRKNKPKK